MHLANRPVFGSRLPTVWGISKKPGAALKTLWPNLNSCCSSPLQQLAVDVQHLRDHGRALVVDDDGIAELHLDVLVDLVVHPAKDLFPGDVVAQHSPTDA